MRASIRWLPLVLLLPSCAAGSDGETADPSATAATSTAAGGGGHGGGGTTTSSTTGAGGATTSSTSSTGAGGATTTSTSSTGAGGATTSSTSSTGAGGATTSSTSTTGAGGATTSSTSTTGAGGATTSSTSTTSTSTGPVDIGLYTYAPIPTPGLINPPSAAWHPDGTYALVLNTTNNVYRYDPTTKSLSEVASAGSTVAWRSVSFTPDGAKAVLLGNVTSPEEGRIYLWDSATSILSEMPDTAQPQITYEALAWSPDKAAARLLGAKKNGSTWLAYLWSFDPSTGLSDLKASATSAMCQDLAWATDAFDRPAVAVTCGGNGVTLFHVDFDGQIIKYNGNAGNTSRTSGRPQGDYALAVGWSGQRVYRFQQGGWNTDFANPTLPGIFQVQFSSDGRRALLLGGFGKVYEFRHDLMQKEDIVDASIPNFASPPYNAESQVSLNDAAWRPGCDGGLLVGGANTWSIQKGYVIRFSVQNGVACPN